MISTFAAINATEAAPHTNLLRVRCRRNVTPESASGLDRLGAEETFVTARLIDIAGQRRGWLTAVSYDRTRLQWFCVCDCGTEKYLAGSAFRKCKSCGCQRSAATIARNLQHGDAPRKRQTPEYRAWCGAIKRCHNPKNDSWEHYGGRGIIVCDRWRFGTTQKTGYQCFLENVGRKPTAKHSLDRINNDGNYEPGNCRWATPDVQMSNRRGRRLVVFRGRAFPVAVAARFAGLTTDLVLDRLKCGWSEERALTTPRLTVFGGCGPERFSHSDAAIQLLEIGEHNRRQVQ
jgi:hypothetical protein